MDRDLAAILGLLISLPIIGLLVAGREGCRSSDLSLVIGWIEGSQLQLQIPWDLGSHHWIELAAFGEESLNVAMPRRQSA